jgi:hypothetical protein
MDATTAEEAQDDGQAEESDETAMAAAIRTALLEVHTCMPGTVLSFSAATQTAKVQPNIARLFVGIGYVTLPPCLDVPVVFPRGGGYAMTFPVGAGDPCLLLFSERAIDFWFKNGGVQLPAKPRMHSLSDAFALVGASPLTAVIPDFNASAVELRRVDGTGAKIVLDGTTAHVGGTGGEFIAKGEGTLSYLNAIQAAISGLGGTLLPPVSADILATKGKVV